MNGDPPEPEPRRTPAESPPADLQERIRELAYAMWEAGGHQHGRALEYWLEAERRLLASAGGEAARRGSEEEPAPPGRP